MKDTGSARDERHGGGRPSGLRGISRVFPDLQEDLLLNLFHKGARVQWTSADLDWAPPMRLSDRQRESLARLLTPVYFGEQTAMLGASGILPQLAAAGETTAQLYLTSFIMDEARHFEALTRLYRKLGHDPMGLRRMPELLRYHHRIRQGDRADWVWGILFSDVIAKHFYRSFGVAQDDPLFGGMSRRILQDESRHLAFADHYLRRSVAKMEPARRRALLDMRDDLFGLLGSMTERVYADAAAFGVDGNDYLAAVWADVENHARRIGLTGGEPPDAGVPDAPRPDGRAASAAGDPAAGDPAAGDPAAGDPAAGDPAAGDPAADGPAVPDGPAAGGPAADGPAAGGPAADGPAGPPASNRRAGTEPERPRSRIVQVSRPRCFGCLLSLFCGRRLVPA